MEELPEIAFVGEIHDDTPLWRYMRLSTLLTILRGSVFIPTIDTLRRGDPTEATRVCRDTFDYFRDELNEDDRTGLGDLANAEERAILGHPCADRQARNIYFQIWKRELGKRRCVWCWQRALGESKALWDLYARDGIAVSSTPARIRKALKIESVDSGILADVRYPETPELQTDRDAFLRPYLFKHIGYRHEEEVRLIIPSEPTPGKLGHKLQVDWHQLIKEVRLSPHFPSDEAIELRHALRTFSLGNPGDNYAMDIPCFLSQIHQHRELFSQDPPSSANALPYDIANFGSHKMPYLLSDDIRRELKTRPEW